MLTHSLSSLTACFSFHLLSHPALDQVRFEGYILTLNPSLKLIAPVREWGMGREEEIAYAHKHNIPIKQKAASPYSYDENMWSNTGSKSFDSFTHQAKELM